MSASKAHETAAAPRFAAVRHLARRRIEDLVVVLDLRRSRIFGLNPSAGEVLDALQSPQTVEQVASRFGATGAETSQEIRRFVDEISDLGWIVPHEPGAGVEMEKASQAAAEPPLWAPPAILWQEEVARVTNQVSQPQAIGNPACLP